MIKIGKYEQVSQIIECNDSIIIGKNHTIDGKSFMKTTSTGAYLYKDGELQLLFEDDIWYLVRYEDALVFRKNESDMSMVYDFDTLQKIYLPDDLLFGNTYFNGNQYYLALAKRSDQTQSPRVPAPIYIKRFNEGPIRMENVGPNVLYQDRMYAYSQKHACVTCFTFDKKIIWLYDASMLGKRRVYDRETGELLVEKDHQVNYNIMVDEQHVFLPLEGGKLIGLDRSKGQPVWICEELPGSGRYNQDEEHLYKCDGLRVAKIRKTDGYVDKILNLGETYKRFYSNGPVGVYDDVVIVANIHDGDIIILSKDIDEIIGYCEVGLPALINAPSTILWKDDTLFALDKANVLHVFQVEKEHI